MSLESAWRWLFVPKWPDWVDQPTKWYQLSMQPKAMVNSFLTSIASNLVFFNSVVSDIAAKMLCILLLLPHFL